MEDNISRLAANCPYLTFIDLSNQNIDISKVTILAHMLESNTHVVSLNLEGNPIYNTGAFILCKMLKKNTTLTDLNINNTQIKDEGARALGKMILARKAPIEISLIKNFTITGCYDNTVYHMIKSRK